MERSGEQTLRFIGAGRLAQDAGMVDAQTAVPLQCPLSSARRALGTYSTESLGWISSDSPVLGAAAKANSIAAVAATASAAALLSFRFS